MAQLDGIAVISGGGGGIGAGCAITFAEAGVIGLVIADINETTAAEAAEQSRKVAINARFRALVIKVDITDEHSVGSMVDTAVKEFGRIDYAINSAGIDNASYESIEASSLDDYENVMNVNAKGTMSFNRAVTKAMLTQAPRTIETKTGQRDIGRGCIVNIASANSFVPLPGKLAYVTSKHAVMGITKSAAIDCQRRGIRVNAVCSTWVRTPLFEDECRKNPRLAKIVAAVSPLGRPAELDEVCGAIKFLCSPDANYITGIGLLIDAGLTLNIPLD